MPLYEYECAAHGGFEMLRSVSEYAAPAPCPDCGELGPRVVSLPGTSFMAKSEVIARDRNERSSHEPRVSGHKPGDHVHGPGCGHGHAPAPKKTGLQRYGGKRPWVMEHG
jgi:putative FmdB family regulatory protein